MICATRDPRFSNLTIWILGELWKIPLHGRHPGPSGPESLGEQGTDTTYLWNSPGHAKGPPNLQNGVVSDRVTHPHMLCDWHLLLASAFRETVCPQRPTQSPKIHEHPSNKVSNTNQQPCVPTHTSPTVSPWPQLSREIYYMLICYFWMLSNIFL